MYWLIQKVCQFFLWFIRSVLKLVNPSFLYQCKILIVMPNEQPFPFFKVLMFCLFALGLPWQAKSTELPVKSKIRGVTVFLQGAQINRTAKVILKAGEQTLVFAGLPATLNPASIQVSGEGQLVVLGVTHEIDYQEKQSMSDQLSALESKVKEVKRQIEREQTRLAVLDKEEKLILANQQLGGEQQGVSVEALRQAAAFYRQRLQEIALAQLEIRQSLEELKEKQQEFQNELGASRVKLNEPSSKVLVQVRAERQQEASLEVSYLVENAGWFPAYDVRVEEPGQPLSFTYKARVYQQTGEDWENVQLSISTGNPKTNNNLPRLEPKRVNFPDYVRRVGPNKGPVSRVQGKVTSATDGLGLPGVTVRVKGTTVGATTDFEGNYSLNIPSGAQLLTFSFVGFKTVEVPIHSEVIDVRLEEDIQELQEVVVTAYGIEGKLAGKVAGVNTNKRNNKIRGTASLPAPEIVSVQNTVTTEFVIKKPYSLASDGKERVVEMQQSSLPTHYRYYAAPELEEAAYLTARLTGWEDLSLLQGEASLYFEGKFVGKSLLDPFAVNDTLEFALGTDKQVVVQREEIKDFSEKQFLGSRRKETHAYKLSVKNNRVHPIDILLEERYPVSGNENIEVELLESNKAEVKEDEGLLQWSLRLEPKAKEEAQYRYSLRYPANKKIIIF